MDLYYCYRVAAWLSRTLPRNFSYRLASWVSWFFHRFDLRGREAVQANLRQILAARGEDASEGRIARLSRETFACFGKYLVDFFRYAQIDPQRLDEIVEVDHPEYIHQAAAPGKGVIAVSAHFGNWEMGGAAICALGYRLHTVVLPDRFEKVNRLFETQRRKRGFDVTFLGHSASVVLRALRRAEFVGLLADVDFTGRNHVVNFFGRPARLPRGPAYLAHRLGVPVMPGFVRRREDDKLILHVYPPIMPEANLSQEAIQGRICAALEDMVGRYPHQWFVFRSFWDGVPAPAVSTEAAARPCAAGGRA